MHAKIGISLENRLSPTWASHTISRKLFILVHVIYDHDIWQYMDVDSFDVQYLFDDGNGKGETTRDIPVHTAWMQVYP